MTRFRGILGENVAFPTECAYLVHLSRVSRRKYVQLHQFGDDRQ